MSEPSTTSLEDEFASGLRSGAPVVDRRDVVLAPYTTWGIGGPAERLVEPTTPFAFGAAVAAARDAGEPLTLLGRGSNVLIDDDGIPGTVICLRHTLTGVASIDRESGTYRVQAGCPLPRLATTAMRDGIAGFEFLIGIPGTVGAGVAINAGVGGRDGVAMDSVVRDALVFDPIDATIERVPASDLGLRYRGSDVLARQAWVLEATVQGTPSDPETVRTRHRDVLAARASKQPLQRKTSGSVFKQPDGGRPAGWYLDRAGAKGMSVGDAVVSDLHANWIENRGQASARDVVALIGRMRTAVEETFGLTLEREVRYLPHETLARFGDSLREASERS